MNMDINMILHVLHLRDCVFDGVLEFIVVGCGGLLLELSAVGLLGETLPAVEHAWMS